MVKGEASDRTQKPQSWHRYWRKAGITIGALMAFVIVSPILEYEMGLQRPLVSITAIVIALGFVLGLIWMAPDLRRYRKWREEQLRRGNGKALGK